MKDGCYTPNGELQGDTKPMPNRGTNSGVPGNAELDGMSVDPEATNRLGSITRYTKSDPFEENDSDDGKSDGDEASI